MLIGVYDSGFNSSTNEWNKAAYTAMEKLGAQKIRRLGFRDSYALVTVSGSPHNTIELHKKYVQRTSTNAECGIGTRIRPQATVQYRYNAAGQRIYKQVGSNPAEHYILDEDRILGVFRGSGLLYWNIYGNDGVAGRLEVSIPQEEGEGGGAEEVGSTQKLFYLKDHLGSTRAVMNANGAVVESYDYYPFGLKMPGRIYPVTPTVTKNLFTGKECDSETGLDYFGARYYWAAGGRWVAVHPWRRNIPSSARMGVLTTTRSTT